MNKLYTTLLIACIAVGFTACNDDDCDDLHLGNLANYPNVLKGTFPTEDQVLELGETLEITPELLNPEDATYSWLLNGKEISTEQTFTYQVDNPCRADLTCVITNKYGKVEMNTSFRSNHDFSKGFFYLADGTFNFYDTEKKVTYKDCYSSLNAGKTLGMGSYDNANISNYNGKFYVLVKTSTSNKDQFFVVDAKTLYYENSAIVGANLNGLTILNDQYALVTGDGIHRIDLKSLSNIKIKDKYMFSIYNGLVFNGKVLSNETYQGDAPVQSYDVNELLAAKEGEEPTATPLDRSSAASDVYKRQVASESENIIYIVSNDGAIYKYVIGENNSLSQPFIAVDKLKSSITTTPQLNQQTGELYVVYYQESKYTITVYNKDGSLNYSVDCGSSSPSHVLFNN